MSDSGSELQHRIEELEIRMAHQEYALEQQGEELRLLQQTNARLLRQLQELVDRVQALVDRPAADPAGEPPPPHY
ncbi:SlyX family protein [Thioalkalivibrio nitratireducens DSM 14787]|uniref:Protein SlyX homolog n=1 Tax=Thioalkalivibrio nitratireducens (strain DSM 14787 / UNIQEM 213 / ALEN2) TaxID=1255043 RepID=L0DZF5_THIND|nr:SlyX family protein [Thioalkalivibrio nitratireducens]AGA33771.1 SlyX family protein [Thioalkalivibrio nitratireducens DSM 14787]